MLCSRAHTQLRPAVGSMNALPRRVPCSQTAVSRPPRASLSRARAHTQPSALYLRPNCGAETLMQFKVCIILRRRWSIWRAMPSKLGANSAIKLPAPGVCIACQRREMRDGAYALESVHAICAAQALSSSIRVGRERAKDRERERERAERARERATCTLLVWALCLCQHVTRVGCRVWGSGLRV